MPWTLYRYILKDLIKLLVISSTVLLLVIDFAAAIKPLSDGLLGPVQLMKFVFYSMPTMLSFALPFSAAFASTLVFARLASDNEILACRASGMSYTKILAPVLGMGLLITCSLMYLGNQVIPKFYMLAEQQLERDMLKVVVTQIKSGQPFKMRNMVLYADAVDDTQPPPVIENLPEGTDQPTKMVLFDGVAIAMLDKQGGLKIEGTAERADALFFRSPKQSWMQIRLENVMYYRADRSMKPKSDKAGKPDAEGAGASATAPAESLETTTDDADAPAEESAAKSETFGDRGQLLFVKNWNPPAIPMPNPFQDRLQFFTIGELLDLRANPDHFDRVNARMESLQNALTEARLTRLVRDALSASGTTHGVLTMQAPVAAQRYQITAPKISSAPKGLILESVPARDGIPGRDVEVTSIVSGVVNRRMIAKSAVVEVESGDVSPEPRIHVELEDVNIIDAQSSPNRTQRKSLPLPGSTWPASLTADNEKPTIDELLEKAQDYSENKQIQTAATNLKSSIVSLKKRVSARLHERFASAVAASLVLTLGALMSLVLAGRMPLVVYFWSFLVATLAVVLARAGETVAINQSLPAVGMLGMWSGNILLAISVLALWRKLSRN